MNLSKSSDLPDISKLKGKSVLVTGGAGFFAHHLVKKLVQIGCRVSILTKYNSVIDNIRLASLWEKIHVMEADLRNTDSLTQVAKLAPEYIFHFAAYNHVGDSFLHIQESLQSNAIGTVNLMEAYKNYKMFIYIATSEVYGHQPEGKPFIESMNPFPTSPYSIGKYAGEMFARMQNHVYNLPVTLLRPFNCFGPYQSPRAIIAEIILKCLRGETIESTEGIQTRDFNFVSNLVEGVLMAACQDKAIGQVINIGSGKEVTIRELIEKIHQMTESRSLLKIGHLPYRPTEIWRMRADNSLAQEVLGWGPTVTLEEGLRMTINWYKKYLNIFCHEDSPLFEL